MSIKIDKGIPVPAEPEHVHGGVTSTMRNLEVGDSFVMPNRKNRSLDKLAGNARSNARMHLPKKFTVRFVEENGERVVRVWRIE